MSLKTIVTHSGSFHADEALAVYMLKKLPEYATCPIVRTRDAAVIAQGLVVVDVGGEYIPESHRYDHHQRGFEITYSPKHDIKLSSAGLVYKHFGERVIESILGHVHDQSKEIVSRVYDKLILGFDGVDNGVPMYPTDVAPKYQEPTTISARVSRLNPDWNQPFLDADLDQRFLKAVEITGEELEYWVKYYGTIWLPARDIVISAISTRHSIHPSGQIIVLGQFCPWASHLEELEKEAGFETLYVVFSDSGGSWRVRAVSKSPTSFESRKALPQKWRGVRDDALSVLSGIEGCVFAHASGFIGGNKNMDGAVKMAIAALESKDE